MAVLLETTVGDIVVDLYPEERPKCCLNFLKLCKIKYYNFNLFHSVQRNFMAQSGDPSGTGTGGESVFSQLQGDKARYFDMELHPRIKHKKKGCVSMVNNGENQHGSQFFITLRDDIDYLDGIHTVFGEVTEGFDVLDKISETFCDAKHRPLQDIRINHTVILDDPFDDPEGLEIPDKSPEVDPYKLKSDRIAADEDLENEKEKTTEEVQEETEKQEAKANAQILEMIGDLPDADVKPPENVLFVCKLNPVTTSEDLEIIFSRFGKISSCEVIKDKVTNDSLCYAFVEFEKEEDCEEAYFKMDNVLIDDRRIHVDFSQSVAKLQFKGKGPVMPQRPTDQGQRSRDRTGQRNLGSSQMRETSKKVEPQRTERRSRQQSSSDRSSSSSPERSARKQMNNKDKDKYAKTSVERSRRDRDEGTRRDTSEDYVRRKRNRSGSRERKRSASRDRKRSESKERRRSGSREKKKSESRKERKSESRVKNRSESRERMRSGSRERVSEKHRNVDRRYRKVEEHRDIRRGDEKRRDDEKRSRNDRSAASSRDRSGRDEGHLREKARHKEAQSREDSTKRSPARLQNFGERTEKQKDRKKMSRRKSMSASDTEGSSSEREMKKKSSKRKKSSDECESEDSDSSKRRRKEKPRMKLKKSKGKFLSSSSGDGSSSEEERKKKRSVEGKKKGRRRGRSRSISSPD